MHGFLTFRSHTVAACAVVTAALGTVTPPPGQLPVAVHCVHYEVTDSLTVYKRNNTYLGGRTEASLLRPRPRVQNAS